ncbi:potassium voltage-gated channel protein shaw [Plakobranchus ocellatus]|uniref:Potassium voltage-gated channel protein shaw n=1 Tax=Plakobranchus ocellatus TaxID=259542 RepID=A0AAV3XXD9_9GAST|nr:potassium voltage-gated channel protein shaw [Plakobranchus ocellatus]
MSAVSAPHSAHGQKSQSGILNALLPGARIDKLTNKITVHAGTSNDTVIFNVGGTRFETYKSTLSAIPSSPLSKESFLEKYYRPEHRDYFFDRDPAVFHCVLNFFRTGELHLSTVSCGPVVKSELEFWGVDELDIEECCWSSAIPSSPLSKESFLEKYYRPEHRDYFFDRDPAVFHCVLNFFRTGELHLSTVSCGPVVKSELEFWGVDELDIEECCWSRYSSWVSTLQALRKLEEDRSANTQFGEYPLKEEPSLYRRACRAAWRFFIDPGSSWAAQWYAYFSLFVIIVSIFSFCAQTHQLFRVEERELTLRSPPSSLSLSSQSTVPPPPTSAPSVVLSNSTTESPKDSKTTIGPNGEIYDVVHREVPHPALYITDQVCLVYFFIELLIRLIVSPDKRRFLTRPITVIEILALLPDIVDGLIRLLSSSHHEYEKIMDGLNFLKLLRIMRILRLMRQVPGLWILFYTLRASVAVSAWPLNIVLYAQSHCRGKCLASGYCSIRSELVLR